MSRSVVRWEYEYYDLYGLGTTIQKTHWRSGWTSNFSQPTRFSSTHGEGFAGWFPNPVAPYYYALNSGTTRGLESSIGPRIWDPLYNRSFTKMVGKLKGSEANLLMMLAEGHENLKMIVNGLNRLYNAANALRRGNMKKFVRTLRVKAKRRHLKLRKRQVVRQASSLWLEYHFGWSPTVNDIQDLIKHLEDPWSVASKLRAGASRGDVNESSGLLTYEFWNNRYSVHQGLDAIVSNPNKALANRLGLTNLAYTAWDKIPMSFLVDWAFDVGSWLGSFNCFYGYDVRHKYYTTVVRSRGQYMYLPHMPGNVPNRIKRTFMYRYLGNVHPTPNLNFFDNVGDLLTKRGLTAASLLGQILTSL